MSNDALTPVELLQTAEELFSLNTPNMYRASILEAITALESKVRENTFPILEKKIGVELAKWLEEKTRMDFDARLSVFMPVATGLKIDKKDAIWNDYKKAKEIRNKITHSGTKVSKVQARTVIDTVYEWIEYIDQAEKYKRVTPSEILGQLVQISARLEKIIYSVVQKNRIYPFDDNRQKIFPIKILRDLDLVDVSVFERLGYFRKIRNAVVHGVEEKSLTMDEINEFKEIVNNLEKSI